MHIYTLAGENLVVKTIQGAYGQTDRQTDSLSLSLSHVYQNTLTHIQGLLGPQGRSVAYVAYKRRGTLRDGLAGTTAGAAGGHEGPLRGRAENTEWFLRECGRRFHCQRRLIYQDSVGLLSLSLRQ